MTVTRCVVGVVKNQVSVDIRGRTYIWNTILDFVQNLRVGADKFLFRVFGITMGSTFSRTLANLFNYCNVGTICKCLWYVWKPADPLFIGFVTFVTTASGCGFNGVYIFFFFDLVSVKQIPFVKTVHFKTITGKKTYPAYRNWRRRRIDIPRIFDSQLIWCQYFFSEYIPTS
jgi:hypothetical protein